jgi:hypothetical protein
MKKIIFFFLSLLSLGIQAQTIIPHRAYLIRQVWNGDTTDVWMAADTVYFETNQKAFKFLKPVEASNIVNSIEYFYKTVWVDSAKIRDYFDTLLIVSPGIGKIIVIDQMEVVHNGLLNYNSLACFMLYNDTILGTFTPDATPYNLINRSLFWESKAGGPAVSYYNQSKNTTILPYSQRITCIECPDMDNWIGVDDPTTWQLSRSHYPNKGMHFLSGDLFYYSAAHNSTGRRKFWFTVKYHIVTL